MVQNNEGQPKSTQAEKSDRDTAPVLPEGRPEEDCVLHGRLVTAAPLTEADERRITQRFQELMGQRVQLTSHVDPKQLAGIRVELNGYSYDGTLRDQLADLQKLLTRPDEED